MTIAEFLDRLEVVRSQGAHKYLARCPGHTDRSPSLSICEVRNKILVHCFGGCTPKEIVDALGLTLRDLFTDSVDPQPPHSQIPPRKIDLTDVAYQFELGALDRRLRAEAVLMASQHIHPDELDDQQFDQLLNAIGKVYSDRGHAKFLEEAADRFRERAFYGREADHAA